MKKFIYVKILVVFLFLASFHWSAFAQDEAFNKGYMSINLGVGLGIYGGKSGFSNNFPLIAGSFEYGVVDLFDSRAGIGIGGYLGFTASKDDNYTYSDLIIGPRGLFHYQFIEKLDTYAGVMLGYDNVSIVNSSNPVNNTKLPSSQFVNSYFVGARYYFSEHIAVFGELGYGSGVGSPLQIGLCYTF
jgi:hypothetical protein